MLRGYVGGLVALALLVSAGPTRANDTCGVYGAALSDGQLAAIPPGCRSTECLVPPDDEEHPLLPGSQFIYRLASADSVNSLVVLQRKYLAEPPAKPTQDVLVRRERVPFACRGTHSGPVPEIAADRGDSEWTFRKLSYDAYEATMRNGYSDGSSDATFVNDEFHVVYHNGAGPECVSTRDPIRRGGFLLGRRDQVASPVTALIGRVFWFLSTPAVAASDYDYTQIRLTVFPFAADTGPRCLRFSVPKGTSEVDIDVSDIEKRAAILGLTPSGVSVRAHFSAH